MADRVMWAKGTEDVGEGGMGLREKAQGTGERRFEGGPPCTATSALMEDGSRGPHVLSG